MDERLLAGEYESQNRAAKLFGERKYWKRTDGVVSASWW